MVILGSLRKPALISIAAHVTLFGIFSFSFGNKVPAADYAPIYFWGQLLHGSQVMPAALIPLPKTRNDTAILRKADTRALDKSDRDIGQLPRHYLKPSAGSILQTEKELFVEKLNLPVLSLKRKEPMILLHPVLPYDFVLYFKDRQIAHVELVFNISSGDKHNTITIKRKISSGNLEVDLLSSRYISHYLFIQQSRFPMDTWQNVKIDLSAKND